MARNEGIFTRRGKRDGDLEDELGGGFEQADCLSFEVDSPTWSVSHNIIYTSYGCGVRDPTAGPQPGAWDCSSEIYLLTKDICQADSLTAHGIRRGSRKMLR